MNLLCSRSLSRYKPCENTACWHSLHLENGIAVCFLVKPSMRKIQIVCQLREQHVASVTQEVQNEECQPCNPQGGFSSDAAAWWWFVLLPGHLPTQSIKQVFYGKAGRAGFWEIQVVWTSTQPTPFTGSVRCSWFHSYQLQKVWVKRRVCQSQVLHPRPQCSGKTLIICSILLAHGCIHTHMQ